MREWNQLKELITLAWHHYMRSLLVGILLICIGLYLCDQYFRLTKPQHNIGASSNTAPAYMPLDTLQATRNRLQTPEYNPPRNTATNRDDSFSDWYDHSDYYDLYEYYHD